MVNIMRRRAELLAEGHNLIDLTIGEVEVKAPDWIHDAFSRASRDVDVRRYPQPRGSKELRVAFADFYQRRYGLALDPETEILPLIGTKEALSHLGRAYSSPERPAVLPKVSYPVYRSAAAATGAPTYEFEGDFSTNYTTRWPKGTENMRGGIGFVLSVSNPTGAVLDKDSLADLVANARRTEAVLCVDAAYAELGGSKPTELALPTHGTDGLIELHSFSKSLAIAGWRVGFAVGDEDILEALRYHKSFFDAGLPSPIQAAMAEILPKCDALLDETRAACVAMQQRLRALIGGLGLEVFDTDAGLFCWARLPGVSGKELAAACMEQHLSVVPGFIFGDAGSDFIRMRIIKDDSLDTELRRRLAAAIEHVSHRR